jgi:hypothetical protein
MHQTGRTAGAERTSSQRLDKQDSKSGTAGSGLASTGSDQAHEGRLVDALAIRGDEGRGTLR